MVAIATSGIFRSRSNDARENVIDFSGGEDSFRQSTLIDPNQVQKFVNVIVRDNYEARTRAGADAIPSASTKPITGATGVFAIRYFETPEHSNGQLLASVNASGVPKFLRYDVDGWTDLSAFYTPSAADDRLAMAQGVNKLLISDGTEQCQIYDGTNFVGAGTSPKDAPVGTTILCWHTQRMFASGIANAPDAIFVSNLLDFTAGNWDSTTRSFRIGTGDGDPIVGMGSMQDFTMFVGKRNSIWLLTTNPAGDGVNPVGAFQANQALSYGIGLVGRDAWCSYGNDVLFMAQDGVRSIQRMQAAAGQWQLTSPISQPIQPYIARINQAAWSGIVAIKHEEFALFFVPLDTSTTNNAVLVYNGRLQKWVGTFTNWTGLCVEETRFNGQPRMMFGDASGYVNMWKDHSSNTDDNTYKDNGVGYPTKVWTRSFQFGELMNTKTLYNTVFRFTAGNSLINMSWVSDFTLRQQWQGDFPLSGDILGQDVLPFLLASTSPLTMTKGLRGLPPFYEGYLKLETSDGWFFLRSVAISAFINPLSETTTSIFNAQTAIMDDEGTVVTDDDGTVPTHKE